MTSPSATQDRYPYQNEPIWSRSEKAIARKAFDAALGRELHEVIQEAKKMAGQIKQSSDLWDLEHYLTERHKDIDSQIRLSRFATYSMCWGDSCTKVDSARKIARIAGREDEINPFSRSVLQRQRSLICILSAIAC